jgi:D-alanyl-lipoteichoic acid acyltransferase DltB (MBOAT superfamily)
MLFHTWIFLAFFAVVYPVHLVLRRTRFMNHWLLAASYVFYGWWNPLYLVIIGGATVFDYYLVIFMEKSPSRKPWIVASLAVNLGLLGFFKYAGFVTGNLNALLALAGAGYRLPAPDILLPVGISFFTFQALGYTIDAYRGVVDAERNFVRFATFVSLFPQLVSGPIVRAGNILPQISRPLEVRLNDVTDGLSLFLVGFFKKVAVADYLALYVDKVYSAPGEYKSPALVLATVAFGWQVYMDFSGYTDMARGVARMLGIRLMLNFNNPYVATGMGDFWKRWHISLSTWFQDYVYYSLALGGGRRRGLAANYGNMILTMLVCGLWHGASWNFVIWGALHGVGRLVTRELERVAFYSKRVPKPVKQAATFAFVTFTWIFFRAHTLGEAGTIVSRIFCSGWADPKFPVLMLLLILAAWAYQFAYDGGSRLKRLLETGPVRLGLAVAMILYLAVVSPAGTRAFIYFQF